MATSSTTTGTMTTSPSPSQRRDGQNAACVMAVLATGEILVGRLIKVGGVTLLVDHERDVWRLDGVLTVVAL